MARATTQATVVQQRTVAAGFEGMDTVPRMFVLMGNFQSYSATSATTDYDAVRQNFSALASVLQRHRRLVVRPCGRPECPRQCALSLSLRTAPEMAHVVQRCWCFKVYVAVGSGSTYGCISCTIAIAQQCKAVRTAALQLCAAGAGGEQVRVRSRPWRCRPRARPPAAAALALADGRPP